MIPPLGMGGLSRSPSRPFPIFFPLLYACVCGPYELVNEIKQITENVLDRDRDGTKMYYVSLFLPRNTPTLLNVAGIWTRILHNIIRTYYLKICCTFIAQKDDII